MYLQILMFQDPRRSVQLKNKLNSVQGQTNTAISPPNSYTEALKHPDASDWKEAMDLEFNQWKKLGVYEVIERTDTMEVIPTMAVFANKTNELGEVTRKKGRCVARGDRQSTLSSDTFSPVARLATFRALASKAAQSHAHFHQMDVHTAFLHVPLKEEVHLSIPAGFPLGELIPHIPRSNQALRLKKAVYGLAQSPRAWYDYVQGILLLLGFTQSINDSCLFWISCPNSCKVAYVLVYVDDLMLLADTAEQMIWLKSVLTSKLDLKDLGESTQFLGIEIERDWSSGTIKLLQCKFIHALLAEFDMIDCRPLDTPMFSNAISSLPSHRQQLTDKEMDYMRNKPYRRLLGSLNWIGLGTRPDICYALSRLGSSTIQSTS